MPHPQAIYLEDNAPIDARELNTKLPKKYKNALDKKRTYMFSLKLLSEVTDSIEKYDRDMASKSLVTIEPPSIDQRIVNQYSFFTVHPSGINDFVKYLFIIKSVAFCHVNDNNLLLLEKPSDSLFTYFLSADRPTDLHCSIVNRFTDSVCKYNKMLLR